MVEVHVWRTPEQLRGDLVELSGVDWPAVWAGPGGDPGGWASSQGWKLDGLGDDGVMGVVLPGGARLHVYSAGEVGPRTDEVDATVWRSAATAVDENDAVLDAAEAAWNTYLEQARPPLGAPSRVATWADDLDDLGDDRWPDAATRQEEHSPYRIAFWAGADVTVALYINLAVGAVRGLYPASASVRLVLRPTTP